MITNDLLVRGDLQVNGEIHGVYDSFIGITRGNPINIDSNIVYPFLSVTIYGKSVISPSSILVTNTIANEGWHYTYSSSSGSGGIDHTDAPGGTEYILRGIPELSGSIYKDPERVYVDTSNIAMICDTVEWDVDNAQVITRRLNQVNILGTEQIVQVPTGTTGKSAWAIKIGKLARYADDNTKPNIAVSKSVPTVSVSDINNCNEGLSVCNSPYGNVKAGWLMLYKEDYATMTLDEVKLALSSDIIVVIYELKTYEMSRSNNGFVLGNVGTVNGNCQLSHNSEYDIVVKYAKSATLEQAIYYSEVGQTLREHIKNHPSGSGSGGDGGLGGDEGSGGDTGSGGNFVYQGSNIDVLDRIRIGGI